MPSGRTSSCSGISACPRTRATTPSPAPRPVRVGIDLGGTKIYGVAVDADGQVQREAKAKTPVHGGPLAVVDAIAELIGGLGPEISSVGVGAPGAIDHERGEVRQAPNLPGWVEPFALGAALSDALDGLPVAVDNDVNVGTMAEWQLGAGHGERELLGVFVGTGVGGGLILDGELRRGARGYAGEIGHVVVRPGGRLCGCGGRGHLEAYAGRAAMERRARALEAKGTDTVLVELARAKRMTSSVFAKALASGDAVAVELIDEAVAALGTAVATAVTLLDLPLVVVGGGLADKLGAPFVARVEQAVRAQLFAKDVALRVVPADLKDRGGAIGAALIAPKD